MTLREELAALGSFYDVSVDDILRMHGSALDRYAEWVLGRDDFALVTLGDVASLCELTPGPAAMRLARAASEWPSAVTGIKLEPGGHRAPTLYIRTVCNWSDGLAWLAADGNIDAATLSRLPRSRALYGLGFQGDVIKTYALAPGGFVSYRLDNCGLHQEYKDYRADVPWHEIDWPDVRWSAIAALGHSLGFRVAGHVGVTSSAELKIYVERTGAIATDRSLA
jgi:hypothetical protein